MRGAGFAPGRTPTSRRNTMTKLPPVVRIARWAFLIAVFLAVASPLSVVAQSPVDATSPTTTAPQQPSAAPPQPLATGGQAAQAGQAAQEEPLEQPTPQTRQAPKDPPLPLAPGKPELEIYGFGQADAIVEFEQINPDWYDVLRPSKLPAFHHEFGRDGHFYLSPRQSRFGAKANIPTENGDVFAQFEFDMFGVGAFAGETTIRLRH